MSMRNQKPKWISLLQRQSKKKDPYQSLFSKIGNEDQSVSGKEDASINSSCNGRQFVDSQVRMWTANGWRFNSAVQPPMLTAIIRVSGHHCPHLRAYPARCCLREHWRTSDILLCSPTAASLRLHAPTFHVETKMRKEHYKYIVLSVHTQTGPEAIQWERNCTCTDLFLSSNLRIRALLMIHVVLSFLVFSDVTRQRGQSTLFFQSACKHTN